MVRIAIDDRKSDTEKKYIRMRCDWLQKQYGYTPEQWASVLMFTPRNDPDWDCIWGLAAGATE